MPAYPNQYYPQGNYGYNQYNPLAPYQDRLMQMQNQYNQQYQYNPIQQQVMQTGLNGEVVDGIDVVRAKNVDMTGNVTFYPKADLTEIYTKQLMPDGTSKIITYKATSPESPISKENTEPIDMSALNLMFNQFKQDISKEINELKDLIPGIASTQKAQRGGKQNDAV